MTNQNNHGGDYPHDDSKLHRNYNSSNDPPLMTQRNHTNEGMMMNHTNNSNNNTTSRSRIHHSNNTMNNDITNSNSCNGIHKDHASNSSNTTTTGSQYRNGNGSSSHGSSSHGSSSSSKTTTTSSTSITRNNGSHANRRPSRGWTTTTTSSNSSSSSSSSSSNSEWRLWRWWMPLQPSSSSLSSLPRISGKPPPPPPQQQQQQQQQQRSLHLPPPSSRQPPPPPPRKQRRRFPVTTTIWSLSSSSSSLFVMVTILVALLCTSYSLYTAFHYHPPPEEDATTTSSSSSTTTTTTSSSNSNSINQNLIFDSAKLRSLQNYNSHKNSATNNNVQTITTTGTSSSTTASSTSSLSSNVHDLYQYFSSSAASLVRGGGGGGGKSSSSSSSSNSGQRSIPSPSSFFSTNNKFGSSSNSNNNDDTTVKEVAQRTLTFRRFIAPSTSTNTEAPPMLLDIILYPTRTYTEQQIRQWTDADIVAEIEPTATTPKMTHYEKAFHMKRTAYATLVDIVPTNDTSSVSSDSIINNITRYRTRTTDTTDRNYDTTTMKEEEEDVPFIDAPLRCLRIHNGQYMIDAQPPQRQQISSSSSSSSSRPPPPSLLPPIDHQKPTIAIITSTQSTSNHSSVTSSLLYKHLIKTLLVTITPSEQFHFYIVLYIAIDHTDTWWIQHYHELKQYIPTWLSVHMCVYPKNRMHHIPFNEIAMTAYTEQYADYYVRVNDDTEFKTSRWITMAISTLQTVYDPPNVGVVGPTCTQGNTAIMTHDMVHRTHIEIFNGYYYPPSFNNWYLDDWISNVYSARILGSGFHRSTIVKGWTIRHMMYATRYTPDTISAQWLPVEYERGRSNIANHVYTQYPNHSITQSQSIASTIAVSKRYDTNTIQEMLNVLPLPKRSSANILIWGLTIDSHYWHHQVSPFGQVVFLEDKDMKKRFEKKGIWRDYIRLLYPYLQIFPVGYTTPRDNLLLNYESYVMGQNLNNQYNWCDLEMIHFPEVVTNTTWDIIIVDAPEKCTSLDACSDDGGPSILQALYMTKVLVAKQLQRQQQQKQQGTGGGADISSMSPIHVYVDDYNRIIEKEFSKRLFMMNNDSDSNNDMTNVAIVPNRILERRIGIDSISSVTVAHYVFDGSSTGTGSSNTHDRDDDISHINISVPQCGPPLLRDADYYPKDGEIAKVVNGILEVLPKMGNMLIWGIGPDCMFWHQSTYGRVIFLVDVERELMEIKSSTTNTKPKTIKYVDHYKALYPELEIYEVSYTSKNTDDYGKQFFKQPSRWELLTMTEAEHQLPYVVNEIAWDVILVDDPLGCCNTGPGRLQSLYMSRVLAASSIGLMIQPEHGRSIDSAVTTIFVDDYDRKLEKEYSYQFYGKVASKTYRKTKTTFCGQFKIQFKDVSNMNIPTAIIPSTTQNTSTVSYDTNRDMALLEKDYMELDSLKTKIEWSQVKEILKLLPLNGNLLIWGEIEKASFWRKVTSGAIVFICSNAESEYIPDHDVATYNFNYTIVDSDDTYKFYFDRPDLWSNLEMKEEFPSIVIHTKWDVIFIDAPHQIENERPVVGKYQSLYMTKVFIKRSEAIVQATERAMTRDHTVTTKKLIDDSIHVFVDDYENKVERDFSRQFFGRSPIEMFSKGTTPLKYARFSFGRAYNNVDALVEGNKYMSKVVRSQGAVPKDTQMGWDQIRTVLANLPLDGNLLVWGLGNDSPFWSRTTTGKVVFLEDGSFDTNLVAGKRWYDLIIEKYPSLEAYAINYTTTNTDEHYDRFMDDPDLWEVELNMTSVFPSSVLETRWDVIMVDAPLGYPGTGPGRYQSLYMSRLLAESNEYNRHNVTHIFVDDFERKGEREFSQRVFERSPLEVIGRKKTSTVPANEQAHFLFGAMPSTQVVYQPSNLLPSKLVPWSYPSQSLSNPAFWNTFIILVEVNDGYYDFFLNWLYHYEALKIRIDVLVIAEDVTVYGKVQKEIIPSRQFVHVERSDKEFVSTGLSYGTANYKRLVSGRATHILSRLKAGQNVIYTDVDTVWRSSPLPYLSALESLADVVLEVDNDKFDGYSPYYCTGFMAFVSNSRTIALMTAWETALKSPQLNQPIFNKILHKQSYVSHQPLPNIEFPNGQMYFTKMNPKQRHHVVVAHNNYVQGVQNKQIRFEQRDLWKLDQRLTPKLHATTTSSNWLHLF